MKFYDEELQKLQRQIARKRQLDAEIGELRSQCEGLAQQVKELDVRRKKEQLDVDRLEGRSLAALFYNMTGRMDEKLDQERREAYAAAAAYEVAARELRQAQEELASTEAERRELAQCEEQYQTVMEEKAAAVKQTGSAAAEEILQAEERLAFLGSQGQELWEAISAGNAALDAAEQILSSLDSAESWGTIDLFGGGMMTDLFKHSHLDEAQAAAEALQAQLRRFQTELADVTIQMDVQVNVDGFLRFADYFFDGIFADWAVMDRISQSQSQTLSVKGQIEDALTRLDHMRCAVEEETRRIAARRDALILETQL